MTSRFRPPQAKQPHDAQLTVHLPTALKEEIRKLAVDLNYATLNHFYLNLLEEGMEVARRAVGRKSK